MGKFFNKLRQVFNIFLLSALIAAATAVFVYFLTTPEQRGTTFWISVGFLVFALIFETLMFAGIAMRSNKGKEIPISFTKVILGGIYFLFVIGVSIWNARAGFSVVKYSLIHIGGFVVFFVPMILINMATLKLSGADRKQQEEGRLNLTAMANNIEFLAEDLREEGLFSNDEIAQIKNLSEAVRYSDPTPASRKIERELEDSVAELKRIVVDVIHNSKEDFTEISRACKEAQRALKVRNEAVINSK